MGNADAFRFSLFFMFAFPKIVRYNDRRFML